MHDEQKQGSCQGGVQSLRTMRQRTSSDIRYVTTPIDVNVVNPLSTRHRRPKYMFWDLTSTAIWGIANTKLTKELTRNFREVHTFTNTHVKPRRGRVDKGCCLPFSIPPQFWVSSVHISVLFARTGVGISKRLWGRVERSEANRVGLFVDTTPHWRDRGVGAERIAYNHENLSVGI